MSREFGRDDGSNVLCVSLAVTRGRYDVINEAIVLIIGHSTRADWIP